MRYYETLYIVNPNFEQDSLDAVMDTVGKEIERHSVTVINHRNWGKKRLAYLIQGNKFGTYILLQFETDEAGFLPEFDQFLKLQKTVIRSQTIRLDSGRTNLSKRKSRRPNRTRKTVMKKQPIRQKPSPMRKKPNPGNRKKSPMSPNLK